MTWRARFVWARPHFISHISCSHWLCYMYHGNQAPQTRIKNGKIVGSALEKKPLYSRGASLWNHTFVAPQPTQVLLGDLHALKEHSVRTHLTVTSPGFELGLALLHSHDAIHYTFHSCLTLWRQTTTIWVVPHN